MKYEPWQRRRLSMKPGLTCLWQISGRNEVTFEDWMRLDLEYIDNWSLWLDLQDRAEDDPGGAAGQGREVVEQSTLARRAGFKPRRLAGP